MKRPELHNLSGRRVLLTGAAGGIGRATALLAAAEGAELFLTDLDEAGLIRTVKEIREQGRATGCHALAADLTDPSQVEALAAHFHAEAGPMDIVMNIAGISTWGTVQDLGPADWRAMVEVNLMGPIHVIDQFLPPMIAAGHGGHLVNVSSAAGLLGLPRHAAYSAGKFGLRGVSEVLRFDLRKHGIGVSLVCPGAVDTPLTETVRIVGADTQSPSYRRFHRLFRRVAASPEAVAAAIRDGVRENRYLVHTSPAVRALHHAERWAPPLYRAAMRGLGALADRVLVAPDESARRRPGQGGGGLTGLTGGVR
ncbi:SDR family oxidoreductase [Streptomyces physcomitrii]|uniref:SDR family oxidoreductase n=1 Tax=Streptomyces physcomitrii TaxID=2724184 RepID=UPI003439729D